VLRTRALPSPVARTRTREHLAAQFAATDLIAATVAPVPLRLVAPTLVTGPAVVTRDHATRGAALKSRPAPSSRSLPEPAPFLPPASPGRGATAFAGSAGASGAGAAAGLWCALLFAFLLPAARGLRRNRAALVVAGPAGIRAPQQRPG
jgi:hypothetical protein